MMYVSVRSNDLGIMQVVTALSDRPEGPFEPHGRPLLGPAEETIDPFVLRADDGSLWFYWSVDNSIRVRRDSLDIAKTRLEAGLAPELDVFQAQGALSDALSQVNALQTKSSAATEAFERGETTDIASVMLTREQASVGFQATLQVRNKLLSAYKDIMSMPV